MKLSERPGFLDPLLGNQQAELPDHLDWDALGDKISGPPPPEKNQKRRWPLFLLFPLLLGAGLAVWHDISSDQTLVEATPVNESFATSLAKNDEADSIETLVVDNESSLKISLPLNAGSQSSHADKEPKVNFANEPSPTTIIPIPALKNTSSTTKIPTEVTSFETRQVFPAISSLPAQLLSPLVLEKTRLLPTLNPAENRSGYPAEKVAGQQHLFMGIGNSLSGGLPADFDALADIQGALYWQITNRKSWQFSIGLQAGRQTWRSSLMSNEERLLFRPGTIDTIYRNLTTGEETVATTDSIAGQVITTFTGFAKVTSLSIPLLAGRDWPALGGRLGLQLGLAPTFVINRKGLTLGANEAIGVVGTNGVFTDDFHLQLLGRLRYTKPVSKSLAIFGAAELGVSGLKPFENIGTNNRWRTTQFSLGLRLSIRR